MRLLILGGTEFLGRYLVIAAEARGHQMTLFNRGQTNPGLFPHLEKLRGNRDGELNALRGREWDAVLDTSGFASLKVRATAGLLKDHVGLYNFISSISVYRDFTNPGLDELGPIQSLAPGAREDENESDSYGARKALCEQACEEAMPGRVLNIRPGLIVGPHATNGRFTYWVRRAALMREVLAPGRPDAPIQLLDVRDLAEWIVRMVEAGNTGIYNAVGSSTTFSRMLEACKSATNGNARFVWAEEEFLAKNGVSPFSDLPLWLPIKTHAGFYAIDGRRAFARGLVCRGLNETARDVFVWDKDRLTSGKAETSFGLEPGREQELLHAWLNQNTCRSSS